MRKPGSIVHLKKLIRKTVYRLKWLYGFPVDLYTETQGDYVPTTGRQPTTLSKIHIDRCIILPGLAHRDFFFSISVIRANSNFVTGGDVQVDDRQFIIDGRDLPVDKVIDIEHDYIIWDNQRWDIKSSTTLEESTGFYLVGRKLSNQIVRQIHDDTNMIQKLLLDSTFTGEVE